MRALLKDDAVGSPRDGRGRPKVKEPVAPGGGADLGLRKRKVDKGMIGPPMNFR